MDERKEGGMEGGRDGRMNGRKAGRDVLGQKRVVNLFRFGGRVCMVVRERKEG